MTWSAATLLLSSVDVLPTFRPAASIAARASSCDWPTTSGTSTESGPEDQYPTISAPFSCIVPPSGVCSRNVPASASSARWRSSSVNSAPSTPSTRSRASSTVMPSLIAGTSNSVASFSPPRRRKATIAAIATAPMAMRVHIRPLRLLGSSSSGSTGTGCVPDVGFCSAVAPQGFSCVAPMTWVESAAPITWVAAPAAPAAAAPAATTPSAPAEIAVPREAASRSARNSPALE